MRAAQKGRSECVQVLLRNGAQRDLCNANGLMAVDLATQNGNSNVAITIKEFA
jgi:ankyrin repeat protein